MGFFKEKIVDIRNHRFSTNEILMKRQYGVLWNGWA